MGAALAAQGMLLQGAASIGLRRMGLVWGIKLDKWLRKAQGMPTGWRVLLQTAAQHKMRGCSW